MESRGRANADQVETLMEQAGFIDRRKAERHLPARHEGLTPVFVRFHAASQLEAAVPLEGADVGQRQVTGRSMFIESAADVAAADDQDANGLAGHHLLLQQRPGQRCAPGHSTVDLAAQHLVQILRRQSQARPDRAHVVAGQLIAR